jgi:hypothetical protein
MAAIHASGWKIKIEEPRADLTPIRPLFHNEPEFGFITLNLDLNRLHGNAGMPGWRLKRLPCTKKINLQCNND